MKYLRYPLLLALATPAFALAEPLAPVSAPPSILASAVRMLGALFIVLSVVLMGAWAFKNKERLAGGRIKQSKLQVLESKSLGARHSICVVGYENQRLLISTSPTGVSMLTHLPEASREEVAAAAAPTATISRPSFTDAFRQALTDRAQ